MAASAAEMTAQIVSFTDTNNALAQRLDNAEREIGRLSVGAARTQSAGDGSGKDGIFDKKRLYPKELQETTSFKSWADRFLSWLKMDSEVIGNAFLRAS